MKEEEPHTTVQIRFLFSRDKINVDKITSSDFVSLDVLLTKYHQLREMYKMENLRDNPFTDTAISMKGDLLMLTNKIHKIYLKYKI